MFIWFERLEDGLFQKSRGMRPPWGPVLRWLRYPAALIRDWLGGEINIRAMSLAYTTLLSLVPLMVFSFAILKGLGARGDLQFILHQFFRPMGSAAPQLTDSVMQFVTNMRGELLGSLGLAFLVYTVVTTIQKVEGKLQLRLAGGAAAKLWPPLHRVPERHDPGAHPARGRDRAAGIGGAQSALRSGCTPLRRSPGYSASWAQSCRMSSSPPSSPSCIRSSRTRTCSSAPRSSAASPRASSGRSSARCSPPSSCIPRTWWRSTPVSPSCLTTLIWVYLSWLILLIGAQLAFYLQFPQYLRHGQEPIELTAANANSSALSIMYLIGRDYAAGTRYWTADTARRRTRRPEHRACARARPPGARRFDRGDGEGTIRSGPRSRRHPARRHTGCRAHAADRPVADRGAPGARRGRT